MQHSSAMFGLLGVVFGGSISFLSSLALKNREYSHLIWGELLKKRIAAHESLISIAVDMRTMVALGGFDPDGEVVRAPKILISKEVFEDWFTHFTESTNKHHAWLIINAKRELNYVQDYMITLHTNLSSFPSENYLAVGQLIRKDFIELSAKLEKETYFYFESEIGKRALSKFGDWHKYPRPETEARLMKSILLSNWEKIEQIASSGRADSEPS